MLPVFLLMWIIGIFDEPKRTNVFHKISYLWMRIFFSVTGCSVKISGLQNFHKGKKYVIICNHNSLMDVPLTTPFIPGANKTIAKASMAKIPLFGLIYKRGSVLVDRNDKNSRRESFRKMKEVLAMNLNMCIYPEGTRNRTSKPLKEFHDGAFRLAAECETPLLPVVIFNTKKVLPPGKIFYFWPSKMEMHFLQPFIIDKNDNLEIVKQQVHNKMSNHYASHLMEG